MSIDGYVVHSDAEVVGIRKAAAAAANVRDRLADLVRPGMSTKDVDDLAAVLIESAGGRSAFLGYKKFPAQICISINDEVVHGIGRRDNILNWGDVVSIDIGILLGGFVGDCASTIPLGPVDIRTSDLLKHTQEALNAGISACKAGGHVADIGSAVEIVARRCRLGVVREYVGHGCGRNLHEPPEVPNFKPKSKGARLRPGMVLAIEPMFNLGTHEVKVDSDGWTVRTADGQNSAHFEHMVLITGKEPEILTWPKMS